MASRDELSRAVDEFERLLRQSAGLTKGLAEHRKRGLEIRRQVLAQVTELGQLGERILEEPGLTAFRRELSKMRSAMAMHQASWPIVAIEPEDPAYIASLRSQRDASRHFIGWVRANLLVS